jgi:hypothetical protein
MSERILGPQGSKRRRRFLWVPMLLVACAALFAVAGAQAVHETGAFELDGNAMSANAASPFGPADDWDRVCHQVLASACSTASNTTGASAVSWTAEPNDTSIFTGGGSKDPQDINQWAYKDGSVPDKDNLRHGFAARYSLPPSTNCPSGTAATCDVLFFGSDRFDNSGDAQQGFWFFQNAIGLGTTPLGGGSAFTGIHKNGDVLVISDFSVGGSTATITVYQWNSACTKAGPGPGGITCGDQNLQQLETSTSATCSSALAGTDAFCGIVNTSTITMPWAFLDKSGTASNQALNGEFYEGGINLSTLGLSGECFAALASETRSSTSTTATLKDFVLGGFGNCTSGIVTTPQTGAGGTISTPLSIGTGSVTVRDHAVVTVGGSSTFGGSVQFSLCGPLDLASTSNCATGGVAIGSPVGGSGPSPASVNSAVTTLTSVGRYCWRADYSGDTAHNVPASSDPGTTSTSTSECFSVGPVTPSLATLATGGGQIPATISDTATLSGTANAPGTNGVGPGGTINATNGALAGGSINWTAFGPNDCTTPAMTSTSRTASGDGTYPQGLQAAVSFSATAVGTYTFVASYDGNSPNTNSVAASVCPDTTETEAVTASDSTSLTTAQNWLPNDSTQIMSAGGSALGGTVVFTLYNNGTCSPGVNNANVLYTEPSQTISGSSPQSAHTNNSNVTVSATATVSWRAVYTSTVTGVTGNQSSCETSTVTIAN